MSKEKAIENMILDYLNLKFSREGFFYKHEYPLRFKNGRALKALSSHVKEGVADIIGIYKGRFVAIEVKTPKELKEVKSLFEKHYGQVKSKNPSIRRNAKQIDFLEQVRLKGGLSGYASDHVQAVRVLKQSDDIKSLNFFYD